MNKIGITGGIGSGKSTVCRVFELLGIPVYYADARAKTLMNEDVQIRQKITLFMGESLYQNGVLDRKKMAEKIFADSALLQEVNNLVHPVVLADFMQWCQEQDSPYVLHEAAILFESGFYKSMDQNIVVSAPVELRIQRVMERDGVTRQEVQRRIKNQWGQKASIALSQYLVLNDNKRMIIPQVLMIHNTLTNQI